MGGWNVCWGRRAWRTTCSSSYGKRASHFRAIRLLAVDCGEASGGVYPRLMAKIRRALISVFDKTGLIPFAQTLVSAKVKLISTGGTARALREAGLKVTELSDYTGFPEMLDGRVKTLHPKVHGALLYLRGKATHEATAKKHKIEPIDLVVVNLYPFEQTVSKPKVKMDEAIEN